MLDKELIKKNFKKSISSYNQYAFVQKKMAKKLESLIPKRKYNSILEIGSYTGLLTKEIAKNFDFDSYLALDIINSFENIKNISKKIEFLEIDIENFKSNKKFDLIVAGASLQWCENFCEIVNKLKSYLTPNGILAISTFDKDNLVEIKEVFDVSLNYFEDFKNIFPDAKIIKEKEKLQFQTSIEILRHLKKTGVNSISKTKIKYCKIKENLKLLEEKYNNSLTYSCAYIIYVNQ